MANSINPFANRDNAIDGIRDRARAHRDRFGGPGKADAKPADGADAKAAQGNGQGKNTQDTDGMSSARDALHNVIQDFFERSKSGQTSAGNNTYAPAATANNSQNSPAASGTGFDKLLNDLGLGDLLSGKGLEGVDGGNLQYARVQYNLNISVMQSMTEGDQTTTQSMSFSLKFDYEWMGASMGADAKDNSAGSLLDKIFGLNKSSGANDIMSKMQEYFNPENTAGRILDMAKGFYPGSKWAKDGDTEENRQAFSDYIGAAIQKGFDQAMGTLGKVDKKTQDGIDKTHQLVFDGLKDFVKNGMDGEAAQRAANTESWRMSLEVSYTSATYTTTNQSNGNNGNNGIHYAYGNYNGNNSAPSAYGADPAAAETDAVV